MSTESAFATFRKNIVGIDATMPLADGSMVPIVYADWTASGRLYRPIEEFMLEEIGPLVANTHTETTYTGTAMTRAYHAARDIIKRHVNAGPDDSLIFTGFGMTAAINKLQRILGIRMPEGCAKGCREGKRPLVLITHMEHHSNQITWEECEVDVRIIPRDEATGLPDLAWMERILRENADRPLLIGAFTAGSNVTGLLTPLHEMAAMMHRHGGLCFADYAAAAPYIDIDMHPGQARRRPSPGPGGSDPSEGSPPSPGDDEGRLDAITFSPHKFLGGPGSSGILILHNSLYHRQVPDQPGGGTVKWTTPFGTHRYFDDIESREDGGTPGFLQAIRAALAIRVKEAMGTKAIHDREKELLDIIIAEFREEPAIMLLEGENLDRLGILSFYAPGEHHNLIVRLLNDRFGVQTRGGCSCAGTYGHILFSIGKTNSRHITELIDSGDLSEKPGWVRVSVHPTMTDAEARHVGRSVVETIRHYREWGEAFVFDKESGEFLPKDPTSKSAPPSGPSGGHASGPGASLLSGFAPL
ncbi:MAG TPA: aminotransferase class V-fold PLP-dependent enzyme [Rectinemataceae bacterium]|nr:aminotransferase class V-fold PLP-dependent enzyme [Rectinemataceae bacterium]